MWKKASFIVDYFVSEFPAIFEYWKRDLEKFMLLIRKGVISYGYIDPWHKQNETSLTPKEKVFSKLRALIKHMKNLGECNDPSKHLS